MTPEILCVESTRVHIRCYLPCLFCQQSTDSRAGVRAAYRSRPTLIVFSLCMTYLSRAELGQTLLFLVCHPMCNLTPIYDFSRGTRADVCIK